MPEDLQQVILIVLGESEIPRAATGRMSNVGKYLSRCGQANMSRKTTCSGHPKGTQTGTQNLTHLLGPRDVSRETGLQAQKASKTNLKNYLKMHSRMENVLSKRK